MHSSSQGTLLSKQYLPEEILKLILQFVNNHEIDVSLETLKQLSRVDREWRMHVGNYLQKLWQEATSQGWDKSFLEHAQSVAKKRLSARELQLWQHRKNLAGLGPEFRIYKTQRKQFQPSIQKILVIAGKLQWLEMFFRKQGIAVPNNLKELNVKLQGGTHPDLVDKRLLSTEYEFLLPDDRELEAELSAAQEAELKRCLNAAVQKLVHRSNQSPSNRGKHEKGIARKRQDMWKKALRIAEKHGFQAAKNYLGC
jgi:hypothetical protein